MVMGNRGMSMHCHAMLYGAYDYNVICFACSKWLYMVVCLYMAIYGCGSVVYVPLRYQVVKL